MRALTYILTAAIGLLMIRNNGGNETAKAVGWIVISTVIGLLMAWWISEIATEVWR